MDAIQRTLIKAGRKDLAQEYYKKITAGMVDLKAVSKLDSYLQGAKTEIESLIKKLDQLTKAFKSNNDRETSKIKTVMRGLLPKVNKKMAKVEKEINKYDLW